VCIEVEQDDIAVLLERKPLAGMDMLRLLDRQFPASQRCGCAPADIPMK
jgi:CRP/FNR family cyclic AMP-dependent transcriptional regulator